MRKPSRFASSPPPPEVRSDAPEEAPGELNVQSGADIGQALREIRESRGLSLEAVADTTRVRRAYLADIEALRLEKLPSRPFTIGYIRAYAEALGLDGEAAVERFKAEEPDLDEPLRAPVGVIETGDPRLVAIVAAIVVMLAAIVLWQLLLGVALGMIYSGSLYFGMVLSDGSTEHGGYHEALIGLGTVIGPGAGALAEKLGGGSPAWGVAAVAGIIAASVVACGYVSARRAPEGDVSR